MLDKERFIDFISENEKSPSDSARLFSFSQQICEEDFLLLKSNLLRADDFSFYWSLPLERYSFVAAGNIYSIKKEGLENLSRLDVQIGSLPFSVISNKNRSSYPLFVGGIKFPSERRDEIWSDFDFLNWSIPRLMCVKEKDDYILIVNSFENNHVKSLGQIEKYFSAFTLQDGHTPSILTNRKSTDLDEWSDQIRTALGIISGEKIEKVVLSRFTQLEFSGNPDLSAQLEQLETDYENCTTFAYKSGNSVFFGATPEKLFRAADGFIETDALAGSISRGSTQAEDFSLETELLGDEKNLAEHKSVVDFILRQLTPLSKKILFDSQPVIKKYSNIQHLYSLIRVKLKSNVSFFTLTENLYPTPAVCGSPRAGALKVINEIEKFDRGLFAGTVGWFNLEGRADFSVGIRAALLRRNILIAYAGCGIINGSEPVSEYNETELKLKPILNLFADETVSKS
jgi:menaquinone-specific isochorismate synthase